MADLEKDTLQAVAEHLTLALRPLADALQDLASFQSLMWDLGWDVKSLPDKFDTLSQAVWDLLMVLPNFHKEPAKLVYQLLAKSKQVFETQVSIATDPQIAGLLGIDAGEAQAFGQEVSIRLFELLLVRYLASACPTAFGVLETLGIAGVELIEGGTTRPTVLRRRLYFEEVPELLSDPLSVGARVYGWGTPDLDFERLAAHLIDLLLGLGLPAYLARVEPDLAEGYGNLADSDEIEVALQMPLGFFAPDGSYIYDVGLMLLELPTMSRKPAGLILQPLLPPLGTGTEIELGKGLRLQVGAGVDATQAFGIVLRPGEIAVHHPFDSGAELPPAGFDAHITYSREPDDTLVLLGHPKRSRLQLSSASVGLECRTQKEEWDLALKLATKDLAAVISPADLDGFFQTLMGKAELKIESPFELALSSRGGLSFQGGPGLEITAHPHLELGPLVINQYQVRIRSTLGGKDPDLRLEGGLDLACKLGPLSASVQGMGVHMVMAFRQGNAGPFDLDGGFKAPTGLGIVVDAGPVTGGGFLSFKPEEGRYTGILQLKIYEVAVKAIGLLDTKLPGGETGFSFLIIITAEFTPIQLGFGFTLNGVGGLAGIHRTVITQEIQSGIRTGSIDRLLFPKNPVANASRLISDLRRIFPPAKDRYVFGPMAIIGWGTPTLIEAKVGILLELPDPVRLVLMGEVSARLPTKEETLVELHISVLGILDFGRKLLSIDASLYDSRILAFTLYGDMALRLSWGAPPSFAFSLGGLNPHYQPTPSFPKLRRLTLALCTGDNPRLSLQAYMALTSNTVQFGARAELYVNVGFLDLNVYGFVGFDVLINFSPFSFIADLAAMISVRMGTTVLFGLRLEASLSGPTPWRIKGKAIFTFIVPIPVEFNETFGPARKPQPLPRSKPWDELKKAIAEKRNWSAIPPPSAQPVVSLSKPPDDSAEVLVDPMGQVTFRQKVLPLNRKISLFAHTRPKGAERYDLSRVEIGGGPEEPWTPVQDYFAPAQFEAMSDAQKLSRPSFEKMVAGITAGSQAVSSGKSHSKDLVYETKIVDAPWDRRTVDAYGLKRDRQEAMTGLGAAARSLLKTSGNERYAPAGGSPPAVALDDELYVIVSTTDFSRHTNQANQPASKGAAFQTLADLVAADLAAGDEWQVVPAYEEKVKP